MSGSINSVNRNAQDLSFDWHPRVSGVDHALDVAARAKRAGRFIFAVGLDDRRERRAVIIASSDWWPACRLVIR